MLGLEHTAERDLSCRFLLRRNRRRPSSQLRREPQRQDLRADRRWTDHYPRTLADHQSRTNDGRSRDLVFATANDQQYLLSRMESFVGCDEEGVHAPAQELLPQPLLVLSTKLESLHGGTAANESIS